MSTGAAYPPPYPRAKFNVIDYPVQSNGSSILTVPIPDLNKSTVTAQGGNIERTLPAHFGDIVSTRDRTGSAYSSTAKNPVVNPDTGQFYINKDPINNYIDTNPAALVVQDRYTGNLGLDQSVPSVQFQTMSTGTGTCSYGSPTTISGYITPNATSGNAHWTMTNTGRLIIEIGITSSIIGTVLVSGATDGTVIVYKESDTSYIVYPSQTRGSSGAHVTFQYASPVSRSFWSGVTGYHDKIYDGSCQLMTLTGFLRETGSQGYNELGGYQYVCTNGGSRNPYLVGMEGICTDSPDNGATSYPSRMIGTSTRIQKYNATSLESFNHYVTSEGNFPLDGIIGLNPGGLASWKTGLSFVTPSNRAFQPFSTGAWAEIPMNTSMNVKRTDMDTTVPVLGTDAGGITYLQATNVYSPLQLRGGDGAVIMEMQTTGPPGYTFSLPTAQVASTATAGAASALPVTPEGYLIVHINGVNKKIPYYNT